MSLKDNAMTSKVVCKVMASGGIFKSGIIRECHSEKKCNRYVKGKNYKKLLERAEFLERIL